MKKSDVIFVMVSLISFVVLVFGVRIATDILLSDILSERVFGISMGRGNILYLLGIMLLSLWIGWKTSLIFKVRTSKAGQKTIESVRLFGKTLKPKTLLIAALILLSFSFTKFTLIESEKVVFVDMLSGTVSESVEYKDLSRLDIFAHFSVRSSGGGKRIMGGRDYCEVTVSADIMTDAGMRSFQIPSYVIDDFGLAIRSRGIPVYARYLDDCQTAVQRQPKVNLIQSAFGITL